ncbi:MAG: DNA repair protein RecO [Balneolaceae bacterium]|nr:DNA repair protein RecO [Balneolaceae bacterium]
MIIKSEAIVLRAIQYGETSLIATLFTRSHGIQAVIAKGARRPKSKFSAYLQAGQVLEVIFYHKSTRAVQTLSDASYHVKLDQLRFDMEKIALSSIIMELASQVLHENEVNESLYIFIKNILKWVNDQQEVTKSIIPYVQLRVIDKIGIGLQPDETNSTDESDSGYMNIETGTLSNQSTGAESILLSAFQFTFVKELLHSNNSTLLKKKFPKNELSELIEYLDRYIRYHVEGVKPRRSDKIFDTILNPPL